MPRFALAALILITLAGCASSGALDNILACTLAHDQAIVASMYGPIGIASKIRQADAAVACPRAASAP